MMDADYVSPDGTLRLLVRSPRGDITIGFDGFPWHTHGDILSALSSGSPEQAAEKFIADILASKLVIAVAKVSGAPRDVWVTDDPEHALRGCPPEETIELRLWDGTQVRWEGPSDG
jgi:hypothetical protein